MSVLRAGMEVLLLVLVVLSPWAFGAVDPVFELLLAAGIAGLLGLWAAVVVIQGRFNWVRCPAALCLIGLTLLGLFQLVPMPQGLLRIVSPNSAELRSELLPERPEVVEHGGAPLAPPARSPISVYPYLTRCEIVRWLGILALFAVVRNQLTTTSAYRRLTAIALVNGVLLALFGMAQLFANKRTSVYGFESPGEVLGPFINRNHFASYLNLCLTAGVGLLLTLGPSEGERRRRMVQKPNALGEQEIDDTAVFSPFAVLHSPAQMWVCVGLAVTIAGVLCSFSRGAAVALVVGLIAAGLARLSAGGPRIRRLELLVLPAVILIGLLAWTGIRPLESRLATLWQGGFGQCLYVYPQQADPSRWKSGLWTLISRGWTDSALPSPCSMPMPNLASAPSSAISSVTICPVDKNAIDARPWRAWIAWKRDVNAASAAGQSTASSLPRAPRKSGVVARSAAASGASASQPFGHAAPRFTG